VQPTPRTDQLLDKPSRESARESVRADRARALLRTPAAQRLRTPIGVDRRGAEELVIRFYARGTNWDYPHTGRTSKKLTKFLVALAPVLQAEHEG